MKFHYIKMKLPNLKLDFQFKIFTWKKKSIYLLLIENYVDTYKYILNKINVR